MSGELELWVKGMGHRLGQGQVQRQGQGQDRVRVMVRVMVRGRVRSGGGAHVRIGSVEGLHQIGQQFGRRRADAEIPLRCASTLKI